MMVGPQHASQVGADKPFVPGQTLVETSVMWRMEDGHQHARAPRCLLYDSGGQTLPYTLAADAPAVAGPTVGPAINVTDEGSAGTRSLPTGAIGGLLAPWRGQLRTNANRVEPVIGWNGVTNQPATARIAFAVPQVRAVAGW